MAVVQYPLVSGQIYLAGDRCKPDFIGKEALFHGGCTELVEVSTATGHRSFAIVLITAACAVNLFSSSPF